jgi:hypothetical protein
MNKGKLSWKMGGGKISTRSQGVLKFWFTSRKREE